MINSIFTPQRKLVQVIAKESPRDQRVWKAKYNKFMRSRQSLIWAR